MKRLGLTASLAVSMLSMIVSFIVAPVRAASAPAKVMLHVPSKSLSIMPYYFGKDKGFFGAEEVEPQLIMMSPPTAIAALVDGNTVLRQSIRYCKSWNCKPPPPLRRAL
jgi:hypothetical protein